MIRLFSVLSFLLVTLAWGVSAPAATAYTRDKQTPAQYVYMVFHKLTGLQPDFRTAFTHSEKYKKADMDQREILLLDFQSRLTNEFQTLKMDDAIITVVTPVDIKTDTDGLRMQVSLVNQADRKADIYFPYNWGNMSFAVIPDQIDSFMEVPMDSGQLKKIRDLSGGYMQTMIVRLVPISADKTSPIVLDGVKQWLILSKVVSVEYVNDQGRQIWTWTDGKYARASSSELFELKK